MREIKSSSSIIASTIKANLTFISCPAMTSGSSVNNHRYRYRFISKDYREQIDAIDQELVKLFTQRMEVAANIAGYKKEQGLPVYDPRRERDVMYAFEFSA